MRDPTKPSLQGCLAYHVSRDHRSWLGVPSPDHLQVLVAGAWFRADITGTSIPKWRLDGPLGDGAFVRSLVARTGHPGLTMGWVSALKSLHFSLPDALRELPGLMRAWVRHHGFDTTELSPFVDSDGRRREFSDLMRTLATRPGMFLGSTSPELLEPFLTGLNLGGDWLGLPRVRGLRELVQSIEQGSVSAYGSPFGAYRLPNTIANLLSWGGVKPL